MKNKKEAVKTLFEKHFEDYNVKLKFAADVLGMDATVQKAHSIVDALLDEEKQDISNCFIHIYLKRVYLYEINEAND